MHWVGFEPTIPVFERAKTVHALDSAATVIGISVYTYVKLPTGRFIFICILFNDTASIPETCWRLNTKVPLYIGIIEWARHIACVGTLIKRGEICVMSVYSSDTGGVTTRYMSSDGKLIDEWRIGKDLKGNGPGLVKILSHTEMLLGNDFETTRQRQLLVNSFVNTQQYWSRS
jgi:hypothetical protein